MKKKIALILVGLLLMALLVGCGEKEGVKIKKYKGLEVEKVESVKVTDEAVEESILSSLKLIGTEIEITDRAAAMGDTVIIDFVGKKDGVAFEGGTANDSELELGSGKFIEGFEEGIVGHNIGETFNLNLKFPDDYNNADLAGQAVVFSVTLDKITYLQVPELTDDVLEKLGTSAKTVEEYRKIVRNDLQTSNDETAKQQMRDAVLEALILQCEVKNYPDDILIETAKKFVFQESYLALVNGMNIDDSVRQNHQLTVEVKVKELAMLQLAIDYIAEKEGIKVTLEEYEKEVQKLATTYGSSDANTFVAEYESVYGEGYIRSELLKSKVAAFLLDNCKYKESK